MRTNLEKTGMESIQTRGFPRLHAKKCFLNFSNIEWLIQLVNHLGGKTSLPLSEHVHIPQQLELMSCIAVENNPESLLPLIGIRFPLIIWRKKPLNIFLSLSPRSPAMKIFCTMITFCQPICPSSLFPIMSLQLQ